MAKVKKPQRKVEDLTLKDFLVRIGCQLTIPDPEKVKEARDLYITGQITQDEVNQYLCANYN